ncbi:MAG: molybdopterin molybdotransferase MoeA [Acidobacteria bacterium]|nr:molybdopterin molybdotransferase MoeA [Acidobacteriota bacterium]
MTTKLLTVEEALAKVLDQITPLGTERVDLLNTLGRVIREDIKAPMDVPLTANSAMDGFAVKAEDLENAFSDNPIKLKVIEDLPAGYLAKSKVERGQAIRIMTGATIPEGANAVVMVEVTKKADNDFVEVFESVKVGQHIRPRGEDLQKGDLLIKNGTMINAAEIGILASVQRPFVKVSRSPVVAILSTGDELVEIEEAVLPGKVVNSNSYSLAALVKASGGIPIVQSIARDNEQEIRSTIKASLAADFVISSGGVSVGDYDYVKPVLDSLGAELKFWRVSMKPGKPIAFCLLSGKPYFGLPGNTVSSMLSFLLFVKPALRKAMNMLPPWTMPIIDVVLDSRAVSKGDRRTYLRASLRYWEGKFYARLAPRQGSGVSSSMLGANALVILEEGVTELKEGSQAKAMIIDNIF